MFFDGSDDVSAGDVPIFQFLSECDSAQIHEVADEEVPIGGTGYLDHVALPMFKGKSVCYGRDGFKRRFVSFSLCLDRVDVNAEDTDDNRVHWVPQQYIFTVFERYVDNEKFLVICPSHRSPDRCTDLSILSDLFGISSLALNSQAAEGIRDMLNALKGTGVWHKSVICTDSESRTDVESNVDFSWRVTFASA